MRNCKQVKEFIKGLFIEMKQWLGLMEFGAGQ